MPRVNIYLSKDAFEAYLRLKKLLQYINKKRNTKLSISFLLSLLIKHLARALENSDFSTSLIKIDLPSIEVNVNNITVREYSSSLKSREIKLTHILLASRIRYYRNRLQMIRKLDRAQVKFRALHKLKEEILKDIKSVKTAPESLVNQIANILAQVDDEIDKLLYVKKVDITYT